jgi:Mat/Ecp fimbriae outer membrane usher protein
MRFLRSRRSQSPSALLAGVTGSLAAAQPGLCSDAGWPLISVAAPEGFAELEAPRELVVDVYLAGRRLGQTRVEAGHGTVRFIEPAELAAMIPDLADASGFVRRAGRAFPANAALVCGDGADPARCGHLVPDDLGVILDRDRFRVDLFAGPAAQSDLFRQPERFLADPAGAVSLVDSINGVLAGSTRGSASLNLQNRMVLASGNARFRSDLFVSDRFGAQADQAVAEVDVRGWRYSAGLMFAPGGDLIARRKLLGAGLSTQWDTRLDKEVIAGTPLIVSLARRARVEIVRNGRVLASQLYEGGNRRLDTSALPEGSYEVELRIRELGAAERSETRFFSRSAAIAPVGEDIAFVYGGLVAREDTARFLKLSDRPYLAAGYAHRWSPALATDATLTATNSAAVAQVGASLLLGRTRLRLAGLGSSTGAYGGLVQFGLNGGGAVTATLDLRTVQLGRGATVEGLAPEGPGRARSLADDVPALRAGEQSFSQLSGFLGYGRRDFQTGLSFTARKQAGQALAYSAGPSLRWTVLRTGPVRLSFDADAGFNERGQSGFIGLTLSLTGLRGTSASRAGIRYAGFDGRQDVRPVATLSGGMQLDGVAGGGLELGGVVEAESERRVFALNGRLRTDSLEVASDVIQDFDGGASYSLSAQTTLAATAGEVALGAGGQSGSAVIAKIAGGRPGDKYEVLVDEAPVAVLAGGETRTMALPPYDRYTIRMRPISAGSQAYDARAREVSLFPGSVASLEWRVRPLAAMFGRLLFPGGDPVAHAYLTADEAIGQTDAEGYFQIEAVPKSEVVARRADGVVCSAVLPDSSPTEEYASAGVLLCQTLAPAGRTIARNAATLGGTDDAP